MNKIEVFSVPLEENCTDENFFKIRGGHER